MASKVDDNTSEEGAVAAKKKGPHQLVKSSAVVKYSAVTAPAHFAQLQYNTDLKPPPSNWLSSFAEPYGLNYALINSSGAFSSFRMAHKFLDCIGEVDVVSDAENIKKLLKIPYSPGAVSMMVHRVENTLLIDEFDIHKHLLRHVESEWSWLRDYFFEHILQSFNEKNKYLSFEHNSRSALQQKSLISKFLHYSLAETKNDAEKNGESPGVSSFPFTQGPALPEPEVEEGLPNSSAYHDFTRNVVWTFEDIQMLLGTDMPIFGGSTHPCISLRLRDAKKPISVLTGIDYWLDNLMSNVPEVVMCYHLDGIVQKYELIKTEDLPFLKDAKFSPKLIRDVAQNILSFLKSKATKAGHTYWLFKGKNEDAVKLYDLTSLCSDTMVDREQNPFTVPVGMLLYRVARNMKLSGDKCSSSQLGTIRMLLKNCLILLPKEKYPQIVTSAHYMLSDLYVPQETDPDSPSFCEDNVPSEEIEEEEEEKNNDETARNSVDVTTLCVSNSLQEGKYKRPTPLNGSVEERCLSSFAHVLAGLDCLKYFEEAKDASSPNFSKCHSETPKMAKPFEPIPMPYFPLKKEEVEETSNGRGKSKKKKKLSKKTLDAGLKIEKKVETLKSLLCKPLADPLPTWQKPESQDKASWKKHLRSLLIGKGSLVLSTLVEHYFKNNRYGMCLKYVEMALSFYDTNWKILTAMMLSKAGDCCFQICKDWANIESHRAELGKPQPLSQASEISYTTSSQEALLVPTELKDKEQVLFSAVELYKKSHEMNPVHETYKRLANVYNEIGIFLVNKAGTLNKVEKRDEFFGLIKIAENYLQTGISMFESIDDIRNKALLLCNMGHLKRRLAHPPPLISDDESHIDQIKDDKMRKHYYYEAQSYYTSALSLLENRKAYPDFWDSIYWELSTLLNTFASLCQDYPQIGTKPQEELEREVVELLQKSLKYCDIDTPSPKQPLYQFRAANLHRRLASLYHKSYREFTCEDSKRKSIFQLSLLHYSKASALYMVLEHPIEALSNQLEKISLSEFATATLETKRNLKVKSLQLTLELFIEAKSILLALIVSRGKNDHTTSSLPSNDELESKELEQENSLLKLFEQRLQIALLSMAKATINKNGSSKTSHYKDIYAKLLKKDESTPLRVHLFNVIDMLSKV